MDKDVRETVLTETGTNEVEFLVVEIDAQLFGINVAKIRSLKQYTAEDVTPIPDSHTAVMGMWREKKETITLIDLARAIQKDLSREYEREIIIVTEFNSMVSSFKVQGVRRIYRVTWEDFTPVNEYTHDTSHITGSVYIDGQEIMILDLEQIVSQVYPDILSEHTAGFTVSAQASAERKTLAILFAEDSKLIRTGILKELQRADFSFIQSFENGADLFSFLKKEYDTLSKDRRILVLTDIEMPRMDGLTLTKRIREEFEDIHIPVIIFSSLITRQMAEKCKAVGADRYISKPAYGELVNSIDEFCNHPAY
ncbi:MAG: chemotaxis protein CheV [Fibrobacterota bacterium]